VKEEQWVERVEKKIEDVPPKYPNYIAALIKPKVDLNGEYMSINKEEEPNKFRESTIVASQRFRYANSRQESVGNYLGDAVNRDTSEKTESIRHGKGVYQYIDGQTYIG
jgi:hypothetical protein